MRKIFGFVIMSNNEFKLLKDGPFNKGYEIGQQDAMLHIHIPNEVREALGLGPANKED